MGPVPTTTRQMQSHGRLAPDQLDGGPGRRLAGNEIHLSAERTVTARIVYSTDMRSLSHCVRCVKHRYEAAQPLCMYAVCLYTVTFCRRLESAVFLRLGVYL